MADPTRIDMARELIRHADTHRKTMTTFVPQYELVPDGVFHRLVIHPPMATPVNPSGLDFNLEARHLIDDLRSALEFCAYDAHERFCQPSGAPAPAYYRNVNFPVVRKDQGPADFDRVLDKEELGDLRTRRPDAVDVIRRAQHFLSPQGDWLPKLQELWNEAKHRSLVYYSRGQPFIEVQGASGGGPVYKFVGGLTFAKTGDNVEKFLDVTGGEVSQVVEDLGRALY